MSPCFRCATALLLAMAVVACDRAAPRADTASADSLAGDSGFVAADDGVRLFYRVVGSGPLDIVIPVAHYLEAPLQPLARADRRLVFYDLRARGRSDPGDRADVTLDRQIADLEAVRTSLDIDSMVLIGWSGLGMEMAVYTMRHPDRVIGLVQVAPVAARDEPHNARAYATRVARTDTVALDVLSARRERGEFANDPAGYCRALNEITGPASFADPTFRDSIPDPCRFPNEYPDSLGPLFEALLGSFQGYDWRTEIARVDVRRLVIHGAQDAFPVAGSREWVPPGSNARLLVIDRAGHFPFVERPDVFFPAVEAFLGGEWPVGTDGGSESMGQDSGVAASGR